MGDHWFEMDSRLMDDLNSVQAERDALRAALERTQEDRDKHHDLAEILFKSNDRLRAALEAYPEWVDDEFGIRCLVCGAFSNNYAKLPNHAPDCCRELALQGGDE